MATWDCMTAMLVNNSDSLVSTKVTSVSRRVKLGCNLDSSDCTMVT